MKVRLLLSQPLEGQNYIDAFGKCGAEVDLQPYPEVCTDYDGLVLCGGGDIDPSRFGCENNGSIRIDTKRDECEFALLDAFVKAGKPVFGICRGYQVINVYFGGDMIQHLPNFEYHRQEGDAVHSVVAKTDSIIKTLYGESFCVNSMRHQAVDKIGEGLVGTHVSDSDGVVEGLQHESLPVFGVQWHPERTCFDYKREGVVDGSKLIEYFIELCQKQAK